MKRNYDEILFIPPIDFSLFNKRHQCNIYPSERLESTLARKLPPIAPEIISNIPERTIEPLLSVKIIQAQSVARNGSKSHLQTSSVGLRPSGQDPIGNVQITPRDSTIFTSLIQDRQQRYYRYSVGRPSTVHIEEKSDSIINYFSTPEELRGYTVKGLKDMCDKRGLDRRGLSVRQDFVNLLISHDRKIMERNAGIRLRQPSQTQ